MGTHCAKGVANAGAVLQAHALAGVGAIAALAAVKGAQLNVRINAAGLKDRAMADSLTAEAEKIAKEAAEKEAEILSEVNKNIG